jgi:uncharacterized protein YecT (DUF1311 family)
MIRTALLALALVAAPATGQSQAEMTAGAGGDFRTADAAMTRQWNATNAAMKRLDAHTGGRAGYAAALLASQRAWLAYRDRQCAVAAKEFAGGSAEPMARTQCLARLTSARTAALKGLAWQR